MSFDLEKILESKRALRRQLAARSVAERLRMLDTLRKCASILCASSTSHDETSNANGVRFR